MVNYNELTKKLESIQEDSLSISFDEMEAIIGGEIPQVYISKRTFKHSSSRFQMYANNAGFILNDVDYDNHVISFKRDSQKNIKQSGIKTSVAKHRNEKISPKATDPNDIGKDLDTAVDYFRNNWRTTGNNPVYVSFGDKYDDLQKLYFNAGNEAYRASTKNYRRLQPDCLTASQWRELRNSSLKYLAEEFDKLFQKQSIEYSDFCSWEKEVATNIRKMYHQKGVELYTYGNAQKLINVAIKFILSSTLIDYHHDVFKNGFLPIDRTIQKILRNHLAVDYLHVCGRSTRIIPPWSRCDNWDDIVDYQNRAREAILKYGYYSPIIWESTHWERANM